MARTAARRWRPRTSPGRSPCTPRPTRMRRPRRSGTAILGSTTPTGSLSGRTVTGGRLNVADLLVDAEPPDRSSDRDATGRPHGPGGDGGRAEAGHPDLGRQQRQRGRVPDRAVHRRRDLHAGRRRRGPTRRDSSPPASAPGPPTTSGSAPTTPAATRASTDAAEATTPAIALRGGLQRRLRDDAIDATTLDLRQRHLVRGRRRAEADRHRRAPTRRRRWSGPATRPRRITAKVRVDAWMRRRVRPRRGDLVRGVQPGLHRARAGPGAHRVRQRRGRLERLAASEAGSDGYAMFAWKRRARGTSSR